MEVDEGPMDPTDPVEEMSPVHSTGAELKEMSAAGTSIPLCSGEAAPIGTSSPVTVPRDDRIDPNEESQKDSLQSEEANTDEAEERFSLAEEVLEPWKMDATPAVTPPPLEEKLRMEERARVAGYMAPTPEGYVTPTGLLSAVGSPSRPRTSPKRKQLSSPEGSKIATGLVSAVKQHCSSAFEHASSPRLPIRMTYGTSSRAEEDGPGAVGEGENQVPMLQKDEDPRTPPMTPENTGDPPESNQGEEPEDLLFVTPPEGDRPSGTVANELAKAEGDMNGNFSKPSDETELVASQSKLTPAETPAETEPQPPLEPDAPNVGNQPPDGDEEWQPSEPESFTASTPPSSPAASQDAEGLDDYTIPSFQWSKPLNLSIDSRGNDFESPNEDVTRPYQRHKGKVSMRATDWTYYQAQDEVNPTEYHPDWPTELKEMGPIMIPVMSEASLNRRRIPPQAPTYLGRTLWPKIADIKQQKSWGNLQ